MEVTCVDIGRLSIRSSFQEYEGAFLKTRYNNGHFLSSTVYISAEPFFLPFALQTVKNTVAFFALLYTPFAERLQHPCKR